MRVDSHHHLWNYSPLEYPWIDDRMSVLQRDFTPDDLRHETHAADIDGVVAVQARQTVEETEWLLELAEQHALIRGVVGWLPLASPDIGQVLERFRNSGRLKAVRHVVQSEPDDEFILGTDFNRGVALLPGFNLIYDILIFAEHLPAAIQFVDRHPELPCVLDHIAKPTIGDAFDQQWSVHLRELSRRPNVSCKFSGVVTEVRGESWSQATLQPYWDVVLEAFGPRRLMFGSDWPVCLLRSEYHEWVSVVEQLTGNLSEDERAAFWGGTATRVYQL